MSLQALITSFPWARYSKKLASKIDNPRSVGFFTQEDAIFRGMKCIEGTAGSIEDGNYITLYWLVDPSDGVIVDAKFQILGQSALIGAAEASCELVVGKNYDQARRIGADLIDKHLRDRNDAAAFPKETFPHLNLALEAMENASEKCTGLPLPSAYVAPPTPLELGDALEGGYPGWEGFSLLQKLAVIEEVLDRDVRPYIALDAGGVKVLDLVNDREVLIAYQGSCTSCMSSVGATLSYIQQTLRNKVHADLIVTPDLTIKS